MTRVLGSILAESSSETLEIGLAKHTKNTGKENRQVLAHTKCLNLVESIEALFGEEQWEMKS